MPEPTGFLFCLFGIGNGSVGDLAFSATGATSGARPDAPFHGGLVSITSGAGFALPVDEADVLLNLICCTRLSGFTVEGRPLDLLVVGSPEYLSQRKGAFISRLYAREAGLLASF
jgi:hypothetical protein